MSQSPVTVLRAAQALVDANPVRGHHIAALRQALAATQPERSEGMPGEPRRSATDAEVAEWAERHDIANMLGGCARAAFEDAESLHMTFARAAPVQHDASERELFERHEQHSELTRNPEGSPDDYANPCVESAWQGWNARAALASEAKADAAPVAWMIWNAFDNKPLKTVYTVKEAAEFHPDHVRPLAYTPTPPATVSNTTAGAPNEPAYRFLVTGSGETDYPEIIIAKTIDEVKSALVVLQFGDEDVSDSEREQALASFDEDTELPWELKFEIGGIEVQKVFIANEPRRAPAVGSVAAPECKLSKGDILQIFADNGQCSENGDQHGYTVVYERHALAIAAALLNYARPAAPDMSVRDAVKLANTPSTLVTVRDVALEEAAEACETLVEKIGDFAVYDQRDLYPEEEERLRTANDCAAAIRALRSASTGEGAKS